MSAVVTMALIRLPLCLILSVLSLFSSTVLIESIVMRINFPPPPVPRFSRYVLSDDVGVLNGFHEIVATLPLFESQVLCLVQTLSSMSPNKDFSLGSGILVELKVQPFYRKFFFPKDESALAQPSCPVGYQRLTIFDPPFVFHLLYSLQCGL